MHSIPDGRSAVTTGVFEWLRALRGCGLAPAVLGVLALLATYADPDGRNAFPGEARLAADAGISPRTVRRHLEMARAAGWITRDDTSSARRRARGHADVYRLTIPAAAVSAAVDAAASTGQRRPVDEAGAPATGDASTGHERPAAPDTAVRPPLPVPTQRPTRTRVAERAAVVDALRRVTGKGCTDEHADAVIRDVLCGRTVANRLAYLRAAVERDPRRFTPTPIPPRFVREAVAA